MRWVSREVGYARWVSCEVRLHEVGYARWVSREVSYVRWVMQGGLCKVGYMRWIT